MALSDRPAERHRQIGRVFTDRVRGTRSWTAPSPVAGWAARDVVHHLVDWLPPFLAGGSSVRLAGMEPMEGVIRSSGQYGPRVPVPDDADTQAKLLAFIGRDPQWTPAAVS